MAVKYYAVRKGRAPGVYSTWAECEAQVKGFSGAEFRAFRSQAEALIYLGKPAAEPAPAQARPSSGWAVDAACSGNPGLLEYRCVDLASGTVVFQFGPFPQGTNNVGEFLALVEALRRNPPGVVYTDSMVALSWVRRKKADFRATLSPEVTGLLEAAVTFLRSSPTLPPFAKWETQTWGENPADFGRKK